jgi:hypothetical protein
LTYVGSRRETVIDYAIINETAWERVKEFKVGERVDSNHFPLEITIEGRKGKGRNKRGGEEGDSKSVG